MEMISLEKLWLAAGKKVREKDYWLEKLAGELVKTGFPEIYKIPPLAGADTGKIDFSFTEKVSSGLIKLSNGSDIRLFIVLKAILVLLLKKYTGSNDIITASPILKPAKRDNKDDELVNKVLILRNRPVDPLTFKELLLQVRQTIIEADEHRNYPVEVLLKQLDLSAPPFDIALLLENIHDRQYLAGCVPGIIFSFTRNVSLLKVQVEYDASSYHSRTIKRILEHYRHLTGMVLGDANIKVSNVELLLPEEKKRLLIDFNSPAGQYPADKTIYELFAARADRAPHNTAIVGPGFDIGIGAEVGAKHSDLEQNGNASPLQPIHLTYRELNKTAGFLSGVLVEKGVCPGNIVAIMAERSTEMITGILGILKAGAAYLPLNSRSPAARNAFLLQDCSVTLLLTTGSLKKEVEKFRGLEVEKILIEDCRGEAFLSCSCSECFAPTRVRPFGNTGVGARRAVPSEPATCNVQPVTSSPELLAYVIYTSGSTGIPKGVPITHANFCPLMHWGYRNLGLETRDRVIQNLSYYFDWSVWEIFITLTSGAALYMITEDILLNPEAEVYFILKNGITALHITPTQYEYLINVGKKLTTLKYLAIGAEKLTGELLRRSLESVNEDCRVYNMYGPTETTIMSAVLEIDSTKVDEYNVLSSVPIGATIANTSLLVLDKHMKLCPLGVPGELYITGDALSRGYLNNPELTAEKFVRTVISHSSLVISSSKLSPNDQCPMTNDLLYKTGDRVRWLPDGTVEFLGRVDFQVKIRGLRIEPGEIESYLLKHPEVKEALVTARQYENGENYLCAYIVSSLPPGTKPDISGIRQYLIAQLPDYMAPSYFVLLDRMPLNPNGKVDLKALPEPEISRSALPYAAPRNEVEEKLAGIWLHLLDLKSPPGIDDNFSELGGHSLKATLLTAKIWKEFNCQITLAEIFKNPTIRKMAKCITAAAEDECFSIEKTEKKDYYKLSSAQKRLYLIHRMDRESTGYNVPAIMTMEGDFTKNKLAGIFKKLIIRHESLRTSFEMIGEEPMQRVHDPGDFDFEIEYEEAQASSHKPQAEEPAANFEIHHFVRQFIRPFNLTKAPLLRVGLIKLPGVVADSRASTSGRGHFNQEGINGDRHILMIDMHHIITDGLSLGILVKDFMILCAGKEENLLPLTTRYRDYAEWQLRRTENGSLKKQESYWLSDFADEIPVLHLPTDFPRPAIQSLEGDVLHFEIGKNNTEQLRILALQEEATLFMVLFSLFNIMLSRISSQEEIVVGSATAGRTAAELDQVIGYFINTLAIRSYPAAEKSFAAFLREVKGKTLSAFDNQEYQFEELVEKLSVARDIGRNPLFDVMFALQNLDVEEIEIPGLKLTPYPYHSGISKFNMVFICEEAADNLSVTAEYSSKLFKKDTIRRFFNYFKKILVHVIADRDILIGEIEILSAEEKKEILKALNDKPTSVPPARQIQQLFEEQVDKTPCYIAVTGAAGDPLHLSYKELNLRANRLAGVLRKKGAGPDNIVGIMMERSLEMIIATLAVLKAGSAYLPLDPTYPGERIRFMLDDSSANILLTKTAALGNHSFTNLQGLASRSPAGACFRTAPRAQITDLDTLQPVDRSGVDYGKYRDFIGQAMVKNAISMQATRGCPYNCAYCNKIWPKRHVYRTAENIFAEVHHYYQLGVRRFIFIDDIFNINIKNSSKFFQLVIDHNLELQFFFPNGVRGDILTKEYIDLMVKAGTVTVALALETASPRLQKMIGKNLDLGKFRENLEYICQQYPEVIVELFTMHGFPTESEAEALQTLNFIKSLKWIHFPYVHILKIYPATEMAEIAQNHGIPFKDIASSANLAFHQLPATLPFDKQFTHKYQADFFNQYFLSKERLLHVLPYQMAILSEDEIVQKYNSYLPVEINTVQELLEFSGIKEDDLDLTPLAHDDFPPLPALNPGKPVREEADQETLRILLLDLSQFFSKDKPHMLYDVVEPPLGLMYLATALKREFAEKITTKIAKPRIDFDNYRELKQLLDHFNPHIIGLRTLTYYRDFFHQTAALIRQWHSDVPLIAGGPYATSDYSSLLKDKNIALVVLGEGELTICHIIKEMLKNDRKFPGETVLREIPGIAYMPRESMAENIAARQIFMMDQVITGLANEAADNLSPINRPEDTAYVIYTSGTTGKPKGVQVEHRNVTGLMSTGRTLFDYGKSDVWTMFHSFCFDFSVWEMYGALLYGGRLVVIPRMVARDPKLYLGILKKELVTILNQTPTVFYRLIEEEIKLTSRELQLRCVIFGGEALKPGKLKSWLEKYPQTKLINMYGITETTVHVTFKEITRKEIAANISNIGKPIASLNAYIMNRQLQLQPAKVPGELVVGGQGVARGYLNRPELTCEKFFDRLYRSGDLVKLNGSGEMEYLGRIDYQVKIRGNRIETGEIERHLMNLTEVSEALVVAREDEKGDNYLSAYLKFIGHELTVPELREALLRKMPDYMIPAYFIPMDRFPVTNTGKVDRRKLPLPERLRSSLKTKYAAPQTGTARKIALLWQEVLKIDKVGIHDNFFDLGGSSLDIVRLNNRLKEVLKKEIPVVSLFEYPTIHTFTQHLDRHEPGISTSSEAESPQPGAKLKKGRDKMKGRRQRLGR